MEKPGRLIPFYIMTIISAGSRPLDKGVGAGWIPKIFFLPFAIRASVWCKSRGGGLPLNLPLIIIFKLLITTTNEILPVYLGKQEDLQRPYPKSDWEGCYGLRYRFPVLPTTYRYPVLQCIKRWPITIYKKAVTLIFQRQIFSMLSLLSRGIIPMPARLCCKVTLEPKESMFSAAKYARLYMT